MPRLAAHGRRIRIAAFFGALLLAAGCSPGYVIRAGWEEASILMRREPIADLIDDPSTPDELKRKFRLVLDARSFAKQQDLEPGGSFTQYSKIDRDVLVWVLSAAPRTSFNSFRWWFPIVGSVPYKGYFDKEDAVAEAKELEEKGYDVWLRPSPAFSTLGWFNDPLLSTVVAFDDVSLTNTVIHEILHNTVWIPNHVAFNETLANVVGALGAISYFEAVEGPDGPRTIDAKNRWHDELLFAAFLMTMESRLRALYEQAAADGDLSEQRREALLKERAELFKTLQEEWGLQSPNLRTKRFARIDTLLNNAAIVAYKLYLDRPWLFLRLYEAEGSSLPKLVAAVERIKTQARSTGKDPFTVLEEVLEGAESGQEGTDSGSADGSPKRVE